MATSQNINKLNIIIHNIWDLELRELDLNKSIVLTAILHNLREIVEELIKAREERIAKLTNALNYTS